MLVTLYHSNDAGIKLLEHKTHSEDNMGGCLAAAARRDTGKISADRTCTSCHKIFRCSVRMKSNRNVPYLAPSSASIACTCSLRLLCKLYSEPFLYTKGGL